MLTIAIPTLDTNFLLWLIAVGIFTHLGYSVWESQRRRRYEAWLASANIAAKVVEWSVMSFCAYKGYYFYKETKSDIQTQLKNLSSSIHMVASDLIKVSSNDNKH